MSEKSFTEELFNVNNKVALVTGGSKGIGYGMATALAKAGANIVVASRADAERNSAVKDFLNLGVDAIGIKTDVTKKEQIDDMIAQVLEHFGQIDILVNNAGMNVRKPVIEYTENEWDQVVDTNLKGIFLVGQAIGRQMVKQKKGSIINIGSVLSSTAWQEQAPYCSSKGGILQLTKVMALEWAESGVRVNAIGPAYIKTPMTEARLAEPEWYNKIMARTPLKRIGELEDLSGALLFLASEASSYLTGQMIYVDGGWTAL